MKGHVNKSLGCLKLFVNDKIIARRAFKTRYEKEYYLKKWNGVFEGIDTKGMVYIQILFYCFNKSKRARKRKKIKNEPISLRAA